MKSATPYLNFHGNTMEAFEHYRSVFGGEFLDVLRYRDFPDNEMGVPEGELDRIAHIALPLGESVLMGTDVLENWPRPFTVGNNTYIHILAESADEVQRIFAALSERGTVEIEPQRTAWAESYAQFCDRFGVQWIVNYEGDARFV